MIKSSIKKEKDNYWFAIYTHSRAEKKVFERLINLNFHAYLPLIEVVRQWSDRKRKVKEPLIKSYLFVKTSKSNLLEIVKVPGVIKILKHLGKPAVVKNIEIENLKIICNNCSQIKFIQPIDLAKGDEIEVVEGPFTGLCATYIKNKGKHKVVVTVESMQSYIEVTLPVNTIKKINK